MTLGLLLTAFGLGLRHGVDWDHIAAIADLSSSAENRRRGFFLSFVYAVGHGAVVLVLGIGAIAFGAAIPEGVDVWMGRVVGATLLALGLWILIELVRKGREFRLRSRWILVFGGTFAGLRRVRDARASRRLAIAHDHDHEHVESGDAAGESPADGLLATHDDAQAHDHAHDRAQVADAADEPVIDLDALHDLDELGDRAVEAEVAEPLLVGGGAPQAEPPRSFLNSLWKNRGNRHGYHHGGLGHSHSHVHKHETRLVGQPSGPGNGTAAGIGVLHGIGIESPTQIAIFVASTSLVGVTAGIGLLVAWVVGLIVANSGLAALAAGGLLEADRNFTLYVVIAVFVAVTSIAMGAFLLAGSEGIPGLPSL